MNPSNKLGSTSAPRFKSRFEEWIWESAERRRRKLKYEGLRLQYVIESVYIPDFQLPNGIIIEAKGKFDAGMRRKMLAVKKRHPNLDIRFVFQNAKNKLTKRKGSMTYWQWAEAHNFQWSEGDIPLSWWGEEKNENIND